MATLIPPRLQRLRDLAVQHQPRLHRATTTASKRNIAHHYDLSNELFALFLDPSMTYSSALFEETPGANRFLPQATPAQLPQAQARKIDRLLDGAHVGPGTTVLEIGTGWGELALRAARRGAASPRSRFPSSSASWRCSESPLPGSPTGSTSSSATTATPPARTTRSSASR